MRAGKDRNDHSNLLLTYSHVWLILLICHITMGAHEVVAFQGNDSEDPKYLQPAQLLKLKNRFVSERVRAVELTTEIDPTYSQTHPDRFLEGYAKRYPDNFLFGLAYGGTDFLAAHEQGMKSIDPEVRFNAALSAANWDHHTQQAIQLIISEIGNGQTTMDEQRVEFVQKILAEHPTKIPDAIEKIIQGHNGGGAQQFAAGIVAKRYFFDNKSIERAKKELLESAAAENPSKEVFDAYNNMLGFSGPDYPTMYQALRRARGQKNRQRVFEFFKNSIVSGNRWMDVGYNGDVGRNIGLHLMPPPLSSVTHVKLNKLVQSKIYLDNDHEKILKTQFPSLVAVLKSTNTKLTDIEFLTIGQPGYRKNRYSKVHDRKPFLVVARMTGNVGVNRLPITQGKPVGNSIAYQIGPAVFAAVIDPKTVVVGSENEVEWALYFANSGFVAHAAFRMWPDVTSAEILMLDRLELRTGRFSKDSNQHVIDYHREYVLDPEPGVKPEDRTPRSAISDQQQKGLAQRAKSAGLEPATIIDNDLGSRIVTQVSGDYRVVGAPIHLLKTAFEGPNPRVRQFVNQSPSGALPETDKRARIFFNGLSKHNFDHNFAPRAYKFVDSLLNGVIRRLESQGGRTTEEEEAVTLSILYKIRGWYDVRHLESLETISRLVGFADGSVGRARWLVFIMAHIHHPESLKMIDRTLESVNATRAFDESASREFIEQMKSGEIISGGERIKREEEVLPQIRQANDLIAAMVDYYIQCGDEETQAAAVHVATDLPGIEERVAFRMFMNQIAAGNVDLPVGVVSIKELVAPLRARAKSQESDATSRSEMTSLQELIQTLNADEKISRNGKRTHIFKLKPYEPFLRTFDLMIPDVPDELVKITSSRDTQTESSVIINDKETRQIETMRLEVRDSDVLEVEPLYFSLTQARTKWKISSAVLGLRLASDERQDTGFAFDRIRYYTNNRVPKAERVIYWDDGSGVRIRWVGRGLTTFPEYVPKILKSFESRVN